MDPTMAVEGIIMLPPTEQKANHGNAIAMPIFAIMAILVSYLPLRSFWRVKNVSAISIVISTNVVNLFTVINAFIWPNDDMLNWWPGYGLCDVQAVLRFPITLALATSLCCLSKGLADVLDQDKITVTHTRASRKRRIICDILFCWLPPVIQLGMFYITMAGRYAITPVFGCTSQITNSWPNLVINLIWAPVYAVLNAYYAILMLVRLRKYRRTVIQTLQSSYSGMTPKKYFKLVFISCSLLIIYLPVQAAFVARSWPSKWVHYSWSEVHNPVTWNPIIYYRTSDLPLFQYNGWASIGMSFTMFIYFGFSDESINIYRRGLVFFGLGKVWPKLYEPYDSNRSRRGSEGSISGGSTLSSKLDLVGKVLKKFETISQRKDSQGAATTVCGGESTVSAHSRKGSGATHETIEAVSPSTSQASSPKKETLESDSDAIQPIPTNTSPLRNHSHTPSSTPISAPPSTQFPPPHRTFFSLFRTIPLLFHPSHSSQTEKTPHHPATSNILPSSSSPTNPNATDLEAQIHPSPSQYPTRTDSLPINNPSGVVETKVWVGRGSIPAEEELDEKVDPMAPKMGTRARREWERREFEAEKRKEEVEKEKEGKVVVNVKRNVSVREESKGSGSGSGSAGS